MQSKILIGALLITNAVAVGMWWRSHSQAQNWQAEERALSKQHEIALKENHYLQEAIVSERVPRLKLSALNNTSLGKCVVEHPKNAQNNCVGPEMVIDGYQKILNRSGISYKFGDLLRQTNDTNSLRSRL
jgi:hypothetical protein